MRKAFLRDLMLAGFDWSRNSLVKTFRDFGVEIHLIAKGVEGNWKSRTFWLRKDFLIAAEHFDSDNGGKAFI